MSHNNDNNPVQNFHITGFQFQAILEYIDWCIDALEIIPRPQESDLNNVIRNLRNVRQQISEQYDHMINLQYRNR